MSDRPDPEAQREIIISMVFELAESFMPRDDKSLPVEVEKRIDLIQRALSYALGLPPL